MIFDDELSPKQLRNIEQALKVKILDRTFKLQVPPNEKPRLMNAVRIVDQKMREIRDASLAHGVERIAVNAALQITYEFLGQPVDSSAATVEQVQTLVTQLNNELDDGIRRFEGVR